MKRYAVFAARFALVPMISGTFFSTSQPSSLVEWAHIATGVAMIYIMIFLLLRSLVDRSGTIPAVIALLLALLAAIPGMPRFHAIVSPLLFATLVWGTVAQSDAPDPLPTRRLRIWILPALVLIAIWFGAGYRHQVSSVVSHIGAAMLAAGLLLGFCMVVNDKYPYASPLRSVAGMTIAAVIFQVVAGVAVLVIRMIDTDGGLILAVSRTAHFTGACLLLAAGVLFAWQYRRVPAPPPKPEEAPAPAPVVIARSTSA